MKWMLMIHKPTGEMLSLSFSKMCVTIPGPYVEAITFSPQTKTNLRVFRASQPTYAAKADSLHAQITKAFHNAPPGHPIIPVRNVEIDAIELDPAIRQIVVEEFRTLYGHFFSSLAEETGKREEETVSNLTKTMAHGHKLACALFAICFGCDEVEASPCNGCSDHP
jgi:hypothetical protein